MESGEGVGGWGGEGKRKRGRNEGGKEQKESRRRVGGVEGGKEGEGNGIGEGNEKWRQVRTEKECSKDKILQ